MQPELGAGLVAQDRAQAGVVRVAVGGDDGVQAGERQPDRLEMGRQRLAAGRDVHAAVHQGEAVGVADQVEVDAAEGVARNRQHQPPEPGR